MKKYNYNEDEQKYNYGGVEEDLSIGAILIFFLICMLLIIGFVFLTI